MYSLRTVTFILACKSSETVFSSEQVYIPESFLSALEINKLPFVKMVSCCCLFSSTHFTFPLFSIGHGSVRFFPTSTKYFLIFSPAKLKKNQLRKKNVIFIYFLPLANASKKMENKSSCLHCIILALYKRKMEATHFNCKENWTEHRT